MNSMVMIRLLLINKISLIVNPGSYPGVDTISLHGSQCWVTLRCQKNITSFFST